MAQTKHVCIEKGCEAEVVEGFPRCSKHHAVFSGCAVGGCEYPRMIGAEVCVEHSERGDDTAKQHAREELPQRQREAAIGFPRCVVEGCTRFRATGFSRCKLHALEQTRAELPATGVAAQNADLVNQPPHYTAHPSGVECIVVVEHFTFSVGNAIKYLWRAGLKTPDALEDLRKARWYVEREIARLEAAAKKGA